MAGSLSVGARLETVPPRPLTDATDRLAIVGLLIVSIAIHAWLISRTELTARDSMGFARTALQLLDPNAARLPADPPELKLSQIDVVRRSQHPPGYALAILGMSSLLNVIDPVPEAEYPAQMLFATQLVSAVSGVLLIFPMYWLGRMLLGKPLGFVVALLFQVLPTPARVTSDGLTEGLYLLLVGIALFLAVRAVKLPSIKRFLLTGLAIGLAYLVRPEGLLVGVAAVLAVVVGVLWNKFDRTFSLGLITALVVGFGLSAGWYMILIGGITQKPTGTNLLKGFNLRQQVPTSSAAAVIQPPLADWYTPEHHGSRTAWIAQAFAKEAGKAFHYLPLGLAFIGAIVTLRTLREHPEWLVLYWYAILFVGLLLAMTAFKPYDELNRPYLSERHFLPLVYVGCVFAVAGLAALPRLVGPSPNAERLGRRAAYLLGIITIISCIPSLTRSLHGSRLGHKEAGAILREQAAPTDTIIDPFDYALWYSGRSLKSIPPDPPPTPGTYRWAVLEAGENPHSATPRLPAAKNVAADRENVATLVKWWPSDAPKEQAKVMLYKQVIK